MDFPRTLFSHMKAEPTILSYYGKVRVKKNLYYGTFCTVRLSTIKLWSIAQPNIPSNVSQKRTKNTVFSTKKIVESKQNVFSYKKLHALGGYKNASRRVVFVNCEVFDDINWAYSEEIIAFTNNLVPCKKLCEFKKHSKFLR